MPKTKNIRIKKPGGGTRMQRVQVLASGKYKFVKNKPGRGGAPRKTKGKKSPKRKGNPSPASSSSSSKWGIGRYVHTARTADVVTGPAQGSVSGLGFSGGAVRDMGERYLLISALKAGTWTTQANPDTIKATYGGGAIGLIRDHIRSRYLRTYQGVSQGKILDIVSAFNPEILAAAEVNPVDDIRGYNRQRTLYDRGYDSQMHALRPGRELLSSAAADVILKVVQKVVFNTDGRIGLNQSLPKGLNF